jgi:hypothetical protein
VASLPQRHPTGEALLRLFGAQLVLRLGTDPVKVPVGTLRRSVTVDRLSPPAPGTPAVEEIEIGWSNLPDYSENYLLHVSRTMNEHTITEHAAIVVMALLIHELEGLTLGPVLPIGGGGDYVVKPKKGKAALQVEVSGIRVEHRAGDARDRLREKREQVLKKSSRGYASVTTFQWLGGPTAHSFLHYAEVHPPAKGRGRSSSKTRRGKPRPKRKKK